MSFPESPVSARMTKAAFFRSRSPPQANGDRPSPTKGYFSASPENDLSSRLALQARLEQSNGDRYSPSVSPEKNGYGGPISRPQQQQHHQQQPQQPPTQRIADTRLPYDENERDLDPMDMSQASSSRHLYGRHISPEPPLSPASLQSSTSTAPRPLHKSSSMTSGFAQETASPDVSFSGSMVEPLKESKTANIGSGSDEMLMSLLAGQAAMDCERLPVGHWEEVESWKKELSLLSTRLSSLDAKHQRETKILTAARTLQKLNNSNKRMSRQTMESLEQSEKRVEAAEREVLILRDREASLRRRLMEHWSGVMAWEVRRLERVATETQARFNRQSRSANVSKERETALLGQIGGLEETLKQKSGRAEELEEMVLELGRRERAMEEEVQMLDQQAKDLRATAAMSSQHKQAWDEEKNQFQRERAGWAEERRQLEKQRTEWEEHRRTAEQDRATWAEQQRTHERDRQAWAGERQRMADTHEALQGEHRVLLQKGSVGERDRVHLERLRGALAGMLGRRGGLGEEEVLPALEDVKRLLSKREEEVKNLKDEMREVNMGLEEELKRVTSERDHAKQKADRVDALRKNEVDLLEKKLKNHADQVFELTQHKDSLNSSLRTHAEQMSSLKQEKQALHTQIRGHEDQLNDLKMRNESLTSTLRANADQLSDLSLRNESLSTSLAAAQTHIASAGSNSDRTKSLQNQVDALTIELDSIQGQFTDIWSLLPTPSTRAAAELIDSRGSPNAALTSPSRPVNAAALQRVFAPSPSGQKGNVKFEGIAEMLNRVRGLLDDGRLLAERAGKMQQERELLKSNAAKAKKLVEDSTKGLETYQQQVRVLEDRLAKSGSSESRFLDELNSLRQTVDQAQSRTRQLETQLASVNETNDRLTQTNQTLSQRTLNMASDAEREKQQISRKLAEEVEVLKRRLRDGEEAMDQERINEQSQRIQLLDELNSLQAEMGDLRRQLRAKK